MKKILLDRMCSEKSRKASRKKAYVTGSSDLLLRQPLHAHTHTHTQTYKEYKYTLKCVSFMWQKKIIEAQIIIIFMMTKYTFIGKANVSWRYLSVFWRTKSRKSDYVDIYFTDISTNSDGLFEGTELSRSEITRECVITLTYIYSFV